MLNTQMKEIIDSDKAIVLLLLCTAFSLFLFNEPMRTMLNESKINLFYNLLFLVFGSLTIAVLMYKHLVDIGTVLLTMAFLGVAIFTVIYGGQESFQISIIPSMIMPFLIIGFRLPEKIFESFLKIFIKSFNLVGIILVVSGMCDYLSGAGIQVYFAQHHIFDSEQARLVLLERSYGIYRFYSVIGHPLANTWYLLAFYTINISYNRYFRQMLNEYLLILVTMIGLVLCGSRSGLIIGLFMCLFSNNIKHKVRFFLLFSTLSSGLAMTSLFQKNMMRRFTIGMNSGNFSEGRNEALNRVFKGFVKQPEFFLGGGVSSSRQITLNMGGLINSFEYPFMMFAYDFGILGTILIYVLILIVPALIFLKNKSYYQLLLFLAISSYMNGFNALATYTDYMGQFCFFIMVMLNMSYMIKRRREEGSEAEISYVKKVVVDIADSN